MNRTKLIETAKAVIKERGEIKGLAVDENQDFLCVDFLCVDFLEGFHEGVAEFLAVLLKEPACDLLEEIENYSPLLDTISKNRII